SLACVPHMREQGWGRIVNIASRAGREPDPYFAPYAAAKAALINFSKSLANAFSADGVLTNSIVPGLIHSEAIDEAARTSAAATGKTMDEVWEATLRKRATRGGRTMAWPPEHGGQGASVWMQTVLREEMWARDEPRGPQYMNLNYIGPLIMRFGTEAQRARFLPPKARGEAIWCQGFSEPGAGSDLASLSTRAADCGDHFVVNGQQIWTSYGDAPAAWCLLPTRTG